MGSAAVEASGSPTRARGCRQNSAPTAVALTTRFLAHVSQSLHFPEAPAGPCHVDPHELASGFSRPAAASLLLISGPTKAHDPLERALLTQPGPLGCLLTVCAQSLRRVRLSDPTDCSPSGSSAHGIFRARTLEWGAFPTPGGLPDPGISPVSLSPPAMAGAFFTTRASSSVAQSCPTLRPRRLQPPSFPVLHQLLEFAQTHVH